jgi:hypothetical protein
MTHAPSEITAAQLEELHLRVVERATNRAFVSLDGT